MYRQVSIEDLLFADPGKSYLISKNSSNTRTIEVERPSDQFLKKADVLKLLRRLEEFNRQTEHLRNVPRESLYRSFKILKKSGGTRKIDEPNDELMLTLRALKYILENDFGALYHTNAFAYIRKRNHLKALQRHQSNVSRWYSKFDFHDFFGSTTIDFTMSMLSVIFPFSEITKYPHGRDELYKAIELGFLNGGLPQGTPLSPMLTNLIMIPFDFRITKALRKKDPALVYTRYADDMTITSKYDFKVGEIEALILETLNGLGAPYSLNRDKTRYGSTAGRNWNLGLMVNKDNEITVGAKRKREFKCALANFYFDKENGKPYDADDIRSILGLHSYYRMVEPTTIDHIVEAFNEKHNVDIIGMMRAEIA